MTLLDQAKAIFQDRMALVKLNETEQELIAHIRELNLTIETLNQYAPEKIQTKVNQHLELSREIINVVLKVQS